jgi:hypothetical protein
VNDERVLPSRWQVVLERMFEELRSGSPRAEVYWSQQLAFGPVFFYAVVLAVRGGAIPPDELELLRQVVPLALSLLGALPVPRRLQRPYELIGWCPPRSSTETSPASPEK